MSDREFIYMLGGYMAAIDAANSDGVGPTNQQWAGVCELLTDRLNRMTPLASLDATDGTYIRV